MKFFWPLVAGGCVWLSASLGMMLLLIAMDPRNGPGGGFAHHEQIFAMHVSAMAALLFLAILAGSAVMRIRG